MLSDKDQAISKEDYLRTLGTQGVVAIGNGNNDRHMLQRSVLGIAVIGPEGGYQGHSVCRLFLGDRVKAAKCLSQHFQRL